MTKQEMAEAAIERLGEGATAEAIIGYVEQQFGVRVEPKYIPIYKASLRGKKMLEESRRLALAAAEVARQSQARAAEPAAPGGEQLPTGAPAPNAVPGGVSTPA